MITEQQLKADCTPEIIKKMVELAEGFHISERYIYPLVKSTCINYNGWCAETTENFIDTVFSFALFPLLIHRAVEGWNLKEESDLKEIIVYNDSVKLIEYKESREGGFDPFAIVMKKFENYQPESLTPGECACLHCLIEVLK